MGNFVSMFRKVVHVFCNLFGLWTLAKGVFSRQNSLMNWNKCENENTTLGFTDYLLRQARFCKMSLNKCKSFHSGETPAPSAPAPRPFQAFQSTLPHILLPKFAFLWMASAGTPPASSPRDVALIILALLCAFFTQNMLSWSLLQHLHCLVFVVFSWFLVPKVQCKALNALGRDSLAAMLRWQSCREMNCTTSGQAQGGKLSELTLSSEPSCAKRKMFGFSIKILLYFFFSPGLVGCGCAPISSSSSRTGLTLLLLFPSLQICRKQWDTLRGGGMRLWEPWAALAVFSGEKCWWAAPQRMPPAQRAAQISEQRIPRVLEVGTWAVQRALVHCKNWKPSSQVLRVVTKCKGCDKLLKAGLETIKKQINLSQA